MPSLLQRGALSVITIFTCRPGVPGCPMWPISPGLPLSPGGPLGPAGPGSPIGPDGPCSPLFPGGPPTPFSPWRPLILNWVQIGNILTSQNHCACITSRPCSSDGTLRSGYALGTLGTPLPVGSLRAGRAVLAVCARVARRPLEPRVAWRAGVARRARGSLRARALVGLAEAVLAVLALALLAVVGGGHVDDPVPRLRADAVLGVGAERQMLSWLCHIFSPSQVDSGFD